MTDRPEEASATIWKTRDGREIPIREMEDAHLLNTVRYLRRCAPEMQLARSLQFDIAASRMGGEMARLCLEQDAAAVDRMQPDDFLQEVVPQFRAMLEELCRRGLTAPQEGRSR